MLNTYIVDPLQTTDSTVVLVVLTLCIMVQYCVQLRFYHNSYDRIDILLVLDLLLLLVVVLDSRLDTIPITII